MIKFSKNFYPTNTLLKTLLSSLRKNFSSDKYFVSFDVQSLFTQIPLDETIEYICRIVPSHELPVSKNVLKDLLKLACKNVLFSFNDQLYEQFDGMCMGSNLGPTMAAYAMDMVETKYTIQPLFYTRYVDDVLAVFNHERDSDEFFKHINSIHRNIKFTREDEKDNRLTFLDVEIMKTDQNILMQWHLKSTNTGTYINKSAYSPTSHKVAAMRALIYRAYRICSNESLFEKCYQSIEAIFINNGYHHSYIEKIKNKVINSSINNTQSKQGTKSTKYLSINYVKEHEQNTRKVTKLIEETIGKEDVEVRVAYRTNKT